MRQLIQTFLHIKPDPLRIGRRLFVIAAMVPLITACFPKSQDTIKIGVVAPFSGRYREIGYQALHGARLAISEFSAAGGPHAQSVELLALDDAGDATTAMEQANKLIADPNVLAVIGHWLDDTTTAAAPIYSRAGLPILATSAEPSNPSHGGSMFFRFYPTKSAFREVTTKTARLYNSASTCLCDVISGSVAIASSLLENPGVSVVGGPLWSLQEFVRITGPNADASYFITPVPHPLVAPEASTFLDRYQNTFPEQPIGWVSVHAFEAATVLLTALSASPALTAPHLAAALAQTNYSSQMLREVSFTESGEWRRPQYHVYRWKDGRRSHP